MREIAGWTGGVRVERHTTGRQSGLPRNWSRGNVGTVELPAQLSAMISGLFAISVSENVGGDSLYSWQAVAVALINMIGAVIMAYYREKTNVTRLTNGSKTRQNDRHGPLRKLLARSKARKPEQASED